MGGITKHDELWKGLILAIDYPNTSRKLIGHSGGVLLQLLDDRRVAKA